MGLVQADSGSATADRTSFAMAAKRASARATVARRTFIASHRRACRGAGLRARPFESGHWPPADRGTASDVAFSLEGYPLQARKGVMR